MTYCKGMITMKVFFSIKTHFFPKDTFYSREVHGDAVLKLLYSLDGTKSAGYDDISTSLVKTVFEELSLSTLNIVNM